MGRDAEDLPRSFVRSLLGGKVDLRPFSPFPNLSHGRIAQTEDLLRTIRNGPQRGDALALLRSWGLLGSGLSPSTPILARVIRQVAAVDVSAALSATVHFGLGMRVVETWGSAEQWQQLSGDPSALCAFSLTEESPGSDISRIQTYAEPRGDGFVLRGVKHWVTNALWATHFIVVARTTPPHAVDKPRLTAFLVPRSPRLNIVAAKSDVLPGAGVARVRFDDVEVGRDQILGTRGKGFRVVMTGLSEARLLVSAAVLGASVAAFDSIVARLLQRRAFGRSIGRFPSVQSSIAGMLGENLAMESFVHGVAGIAERGVPLDPVERGLVRLAVSRGSQRVLDAARELYGAAAFSGELSISRRWADTRALSLLDGSDHALESYVFLEGTRDVRRRFAQLVDRTDPVGQVDAAASLVLRKVGARVQRATEEPIAGLELDALHRSAARLSHEVDVAVRRHGSDLIERQHLHRRLASITTEIATWITLAARVRTELARAGETGSRRMVHAASLWVRASRQRIEADLAALDDNDDRRRDEVADRAYLDGSYPFEVF